MRLAFTDSGGRTRQLSLALAVAACGCSPAAVSRQADRFDPAGLHVVMNADGVGGTLVHTNGSEHLEVYVFQKSMTYVVSPDETHVAITDTGGTAAFSVFVVDRRGRQLMLDDDIYRLRPETRQRFSLWQTARRSPSEALPSP